MLLNQTEQTIALKIARDSIKNALFQEKYTQSNNLPDIFNKNLGVFVTLYSDNSLRGCIGILENEGTLAKAIHDMATDAAFNDSRFNPLTKKEYDDLKIEISIISPLNKITNPDSIEIGTHGVYIQQGRKSGVFLPQVATEQGWDKETLLTNLCVEKANLDPKCWLSPKTDIYTFTAQIFSK